MKKMSDFIDHLECPSLEGIVFPDGAIQLLNVKVNWGPPINYTIKVGPRTSIKKIEEEGSLEWNGCAVLDRLKDKKNKIEILSGECDYGSEGFLAVVDLSSQKLIWLAFFNDSNPFAGLTVKGEDIYAKSTTNCLWKFNLKEPYLCTVECK